MEGNCSDAKILLLRKLKSRVNSVHRYCTLIVQYFGGICSCKIEYTSLVSQNSKNKIYLGLLIKHEKNSY